MPEDMSDRVPEDMPDRMPEDLPDRMPEDMPEDMPDHMPEDMPDRMPNRMSEDMPDRMPEDLPVRKCINAMVGITRSKVISLIFGLIWCHMNSCGISHINRIHELSLTHGVFHAYALNMLKSSEWCGSVAIEVCTWLSP